MIVPPGSSCVSFWVVSPYVTGNEGCTVNVTASVFEELPAELTVRVPL